MLIKSLKKMEHIVANNESLVWDGWDVVQLTPDPAGWRKPYGKYVNGKWMTQRRFALSTDGWEIPHKLVR